MHGGPAHSCWPHLPPPCHDHELPCEVRGGLGLQGADHYALVQGVSRNNLQWMGMVEVCVCVCMVCVCAWCVCVCVCVCVCAWCVCVCVCVCMCVCVRVHVCVHGSSPASGERWTDRMLVSVCTQICFKPKQVNSWNECFDEVEGGARHRGVLGHMTILWGMESSVCCTPPVSVLLCIYTTATEVIFCLSTFTISR